MRKHLFAILLSLAGLCFPQSARAQFLGYTSPQTIQATLATGTACTGSAQNFITGNTPNFSNIGQTFHTATATPAVAITSLSVQVFGIDNAGNAIPISDQMFAPTGISAMATGAGYFPKVQIQVVCNSGGTFNLTYSGVSASPFLNNSTSLQNQVTKVLAQGVSSGSAATLILTTTPFANSSGVLWYSTVSAAGGAPTVAVSCSGGTPTFPAQTFSPLSGALTTQTFALPEGACFSMTIVYTPNGASGASNLTIGVTFNAPGLPFFTGDPCQSPLQVKKSTPINLTTATTTQLVAPSGALAVYVCGVTMTIAPSGTSADTIQFEYGTGATCGTGTVLLTGAFGAGDLTTTTGVTPLSFADPGTTFNTPGGQGLCAVSAGTTVNIQGVLTFIQR